MGIRLSIAREKRWKLIKNSKALSQDWGKAITQTEFK
jgi:hypothetical protein